MKKKKQRKDRTRQLPPPKMTGKQARFVENFVNPESPAFSNATKAAQAAGYSGQPGSNQLSVMGHQNLCNPNIRAAIEAALEKAGCTIELGARRLREGLNAKQARAFVVDGEVVYSKVMPDYRERRQATELLFRLRAPMPVASRGQEHALKLITEQVGEQRDGSSETNEPPHLPEVVSPKRISRTDGVLEQLRDLNVQAQRLKEKAERGGDFRTALVAVREVSRIAELMAKLRGELAEGGETKILNVNLDSETAKRIVNTFLARHQESEVKE
jgi:hypothetical protein